MKRNLLKLSFVLFGLLFVLAACGGEEKETSSTGGAGEAGATKTFKIGTTQIVEHPSLDAAKEGFKKAIEDAGIKAEYVDESANNDNSANMTIAQKLELSNHLILGVGERKGGGRNRASILADAVESLIGAIYLDSQDMEVTRNCVLAWYGDLIDNVNEQRVLKDAKSRLQEWLQSKQFDLPHYELVETRGNAPHQIFVVRCQVNINNCPDITESGESRRIAEQKAAELMINQLHKLPGIYKKRP